MKKNALCTLLAIVAFAVSAQSASLTQLTATLALPGGGTNEVVYSYPGVHAIISPTALYRGSTNGTLDVTYSSTVVTNFALGSIESGKSQLDMTGFPVLRYGNKFTFTSSLTNAIPLIFTFEIVNP